MSKKPNFKNIFREVFYTYETRYNTYRIIKSLTENGMMNLDELGKKTSGYAIGYDRWGVKTRLDGSSRFMGLIPKDYIKKNQINKKETKYTLTTKGIISALKFVDFKKIINVKQYEKFLQTIANDDSLVHQIMSYVECEIKLIVYHAFMNGINWSKLISLNHILETSKNELMKFDYNLPESNFDEKEKRTYLQFCETYNLLWKNVFEEIPFAHNSPRTKYQLKKYTKLELEKNEILNSLCFRWYLFLDSDFIKLNKMTVHDCYLYVINKDSFWQMIPSSKSSFYI